MSWHYKWQEFKSMIRNKIFRGHNNVRLRKFSSKDWIETDTRLFEAVFELLCEFVEEQKSWMGIVFDKNKKKKLAYWKLRWLPNRFRRQLSREMGLKYLDWEINETDCGDPNIEFTQANVAKRIKELYLWYMDEYPKRIDPYDLVEYPLGPDSPITEPCEWDDNGNPVLYKLIDREGPEWDEYRRKLREAFDEEQRMYEEATNKAIEVLKIRQGLWT